MIEMNAIERAEFGRRLHGRLNVLGKTSGWLGERAGKDKGTVSKWISGKNGIGPDALLKVCAALECTPESLVGDQVWVRNSGAAVLHEPSAGYGPFSMLSSLKEKLAGAMGDLVRLEDSLRLSEAVVTRLQRERFERGMNDSARNPGSVSPGTPGLPPGAGSENQKVG